MHQPTIPNVSNEHFDFLKLTIIQLRILSLPTQSFSYVSFRFLKLTGIQLQDSLEELYFEQSNPPEKHRCLL